VTSVRDALGQFINVLNGLKGQPHINIFEDGGSPGAGAPATVVTVLKPDGTNTTLVLAAGTYDGEARVFARVFEGQEEAVLKEGRAWIKEVRGS
jgi:hypothetical protein